MASSPERAQTMPPASSEGVSSRMRQQRRRDTAPELLVRRELFACGLRYRIHYPVPGLQRRTIDVAFPKRKLAVFIDGCFWHGCPDHGTSPRANYEWWTSKIDGNRARDLQTTEALESAGWSVLRFWEHEDFRDVGRRITAEVTARAARLDGVDVRGDEKPACQEN